MRNKGDDCEVITTRIYELLLGPKHSESISSKAASYMKSLGSRSTWADINYKELNQASWKATGHLARLRVMALALRQQGGKLSGSIPLKDAIIRGLEHWLNKDYRHHNWWWNEIGVPKSMGDVLVLMEKDLSKTQLSAGIKIVKRSKTSRTGQNLVWTAGNQVVWGCLAKDEKAVGSALKRMAQEVRIVNGGTDKDEGIKADYSFWQHGACLYSGGYGRGFSVDASRFAWLARGTKWKFPGKATRLLSAYLLDHQRWVVQGDALDYGTIGREIARSAAGRSRSLASACKYLMEVDAERKPELKALFESLQAGAKGKATVSGNRHFWKSDLMTHHRDGWYASARMPSKRIFNTDSPISEEAVLSHHIADGVTYIMRRGDEYRGIFPVWNWRRIPGITAAQTKAPMKGSPRRHGGSSFAGGVSDGQYGLAAVEFREKVPGLKSNLRANKAWFFFDREFVALGAGITCTAKAPVVTSVNQCKLKGTVVSKEQSFSAAGKRYTGPTWVHHDGIGYVFPAECKVTARAGERIGSWKRISLTRPNKKVKMGVFDLFLDHGVSPKNGKYAYIVAPDIPLAEMKTYARDNKLKIIVNSQSVQAVRHAASGVTAAAFYRPGTITATEDLTISVDKPCLLLLRKGKQGLVVSLSNPRNKALTVDLTLKRKQAKPFTRKIALPGGEKAGSSVSVNLKANE